MLSLYELLRLLPPNFVPRFTPRMNELCMFLMERDEMDRKRATKEFLGSSEQLKYFNNLLHELKKHLTRYLIAYPSQMNKAYLVAHEACYRNFVTYKMLLANGKRKVAIDFATNLLPKLKEVELHSLAHIVANDLMYHYSYSGKKDRSRLAKKYRKQAQILLDIVTIESIVRDHHSQITLISNNRESFTPSQVEEFKKAAKNTLPYLQLGFHSLNRLIYSIVVFRYAVVADFDNMLKYCDEALNSFPDDHPSGRSLRFSFLHKKIPALVTLGRLEEAKAIAKEACQMVPKGNFNWHLALIKRVIVCFHAGDYQEAYELFKAYQQEQCNSEELIEFWKIIQGYIYFLIQRGKIKQYTEEKFYLGKFLNEMPIFSKDKAGYNINIIIIQILVRMQREQFGLIIDRIESLQAYVRSYTRNPETKRANLFIRMIIKMEAAHFHRSGTELRTQKLVKKLEDVPLKLGQNLAVEIIPYSILWEEILAMLKDHFTNKKRKTTSNKEK